MRGPPVITTASGAAEPSVAAVEGHAKTMSFETTDHRPGTPPRPGPQLSELWDEHVRNEFHAKNTSATLGTMLPDAYVNHVPVLTGGVGRAQLHDFYSKHFIPQLPPDTDFLPLSRTIGPDRLVEEMIVRFTHTMEMDWMRCRPHGQARGVPDRGSRDLP